MTLYYYVFTKEFHHTAIKVIIIYSYRKDVQHNLNNTRSLWHVLNLNPVDDGKCASQLTVRDNKFFFFFLFRKRVIHHPRVVFSPLFSHRFRAAPTRSLGTVQLFNGHRNMARFLDSRRPFSRIYILRYFKTIRHLSIETPRGHAKSCISTPGNTRI